MRSVSHELFGSFIHTGGVREEIVETDFHLNDDAGDSIRFNVLQKEDSGAASGTRYVSNFLARPPHSLPSFPPKKRYQDMRETKEVFFHQDAKQDASFSELRTN